MPLNLKILQQGLYIKNKNQDKENGFINIKIYLKTIFR